ncbi:hypothetical protein MASR2M74_09770 [Paracoccaceae bacterium]
MPRLVLAATLCLGGLPAHADTPRVTLKIGFDPAAAKALADMGEMVTVSSHFFGFPKEGATMQPDEMGMIPLGIEAITIHPGDAVIEVGGVLTTAPLDQVDEPLLNVNVFSARFVNEDNLLHCSLLPEESLSKLTGPQEITCKLLP